MMSVNENENFATFSRTGFCLSLHEAVKSRFLFASNKKPMKGRGVGPLKEPEN